MEQDNKSHALLIEELVARTNDLDVLRGVTGHVTPKSGKVVRVSRWAPGQFSQNRGSDLAVRGKWYPIVPNSMIPPRTIFHPAPIQIRSASNVPHFLELKGYGRRGREMFFNLHESGDVYYGMFLEYALCEFERLCRAREAGISVPLPIAVAEIPREEYIKHGLKGFARVLEARLYWAMPRIPAWLTGVAKNDPAAYARSIVRWVRRHPQGIQEGIAIAMRELYDPAKPRDALGNNLARSADALLNGKKIGYLMRAAQSPLRVGDPSDPAIMEANKNIAGAVGVAFRELLEIGLLHHCPGTGNWTLAGELTDLQDTFDLPAERGALRAHMNKLGHTTMIGFVRYLIGREHAGMLWPYFIQGICGRKVSLATATSEVCEIIERKLKTG